MTNCNGNNTKCKQIYDIYNNELQTTPVATTHTINTKEILSDYKKYSIFFILHAFTLITAFTWHQLMQNYLESIKSRTKHIFKIALLYALFITSISVFLHVTFGKYSKRPSDI